MHLDLLIGYLRQTYAALSQHLDGLLQYGEITYNLLWALFKPNTIIYTMCKGTEKPQYVKHRISEEKHSLLGSYYNLDYQYVDIDGDRLGKVSIKLQIPKFSGIRKIATLASFPLHDYPNEAQMKANLIECG